ncbi:MAG: hypothetical protein KAS60_08505, partial [Thermoplasmata archaeon]|nr:hypothetical protein [Thermoplasmata archaeon]
MKRKGKVAELPSGEFKDLMLRSLSAGDVLDSKLGEALMLQMFGGVSREVGDILLRGSINIAVVNPSVPLRCFLRSLADRLEMCTLNDFRRGIWESDEFPDLTVCDGGITIVDGVSDEGSVDFANKMMREFSPSKLEGVETSLLMIIDTTELESYEYGDGMAFRGVPAALLECFDYVHVGEAESMPRLADGLFRMYSERGLEEAPHSSDYIYRLEEYIHYSQDSLEPCIPERLLRKVRRAL